MGAWDVSTAAPNSVPEIPDPNVPCTDIRMETAHGASEEEDEELCAPERAPRPLRTPVTDGLDDHPFSSIQTFFLLLGVFSVFYCFFLLSLFFYKLKSIQI